MFNMQRCTRTIYYEGESKKKSKHTTKSTTSSSFQIGMLTRKSKSPLTIVKKIKNSFKTAVTFSLSPKSIIGIW